VAEFFHELEPAMRDVLRIGLTGFVEEYELESLVDVMRAWTTGVAISAVEHPELWTPDRQLRALDIFMSSFSMRFLHNAPAVLPDTSSQGG
jgi:hypothetical protein